MLQAKTVANKKRFQAVTENLRDIETQLEREKEILGMNRAICELLVEPLVEKTDAETQIKPENQEQLDMYS